MTVTPGNLTVNTLFKKSDIYLIPSYQREYKWEKNEILIFIKDLINFKKEFDEQENSSKLVYFFGNIIRQSTPNSYKAESSHNKADYFLIDGQQRLTTFFIFYKALIFREAGLNEQSSNVSYIDQKLDDFFMTPDRHFKLKNKNDHFKKFLYKKGLEPNDNSNFNTNFKLILDALAYEIKSIEEIEEWKNLLNYVQFSCLDVSLEQNAEQIFENINSKGKKLTVKELIKNKMLLLNNIIYKNSITKNDADNLMLGEKNNSFEKRIINIFEKIDEVFLTSGFDIKNEDSMMRILLIYIFKKDAEENELYDFFKNEVNNIENYQIFEFQIKSFENAIELFEKLDTIYSYEGETKFYIDWIVNKSHAFIPYLLKQTNLLLEQDKLKSFITDESYVSDFKRIFSILAKESIIKDGFSGVNLWRRSIFLLDENFDLALNDSDKLSEEKNNEEGVLEVKNKFYNYDIYLRDKNLLRKFLLIIEMKLRESSKVTEKYTWKHLCELSTGKWTIEHIIPQKINPQESKGITWLKEIEGLDHLATLHKIGNLTLVDHALNNANHNDIFTEKKKNFEFKSNLELSKKIVEFNKFGKEEFNIRNSELIELIIDFLGW